MAENKQFPYLPIENALGQTLLRPQLPVTLTYSDRSVKGNALLDTGADVNVLPYPLGISLGAIWSNQINRVELSGNCANYEARGIIIPVIVGNFAPVRLVFAWTLAERVPLIFGQMNFFMEFNACFYRSQGFFEVNPKP